jgi:hypothetical protein
MANSLRRKAGSLRQKQCFDARQTSCSASVHSCGSLAFRTDRRRDQSGSSESVAGGDLAVQSDF